MVRTEEGWQTMPDGIDLYTKSWLPDKAPTAHLVFIHGFSDHINTYYDLFPILASPPYSIAVHGFDQRGWGRSVHVPSEAGLTGPTSQVLEDIRCFIVKVAEGLPSQDGSIKPLFLMGHSMGGGEALMFLLSTSPNYLGPPLPKLTGCILESPLVAIHPSSAPSGLVVRLGSLAGRLLPNMQTKQPLDATYMSHDPKVRQDWLDDPLCHGIGTLGGLAGMLDRSTQLVHLTKYGSSATLTTKLPCPLLLCHGDGDRVTSPEASKALCEKLEGNKHFVSYPGYYHKMHAEPGGKGQAFTRDVGAWIVRMVQGHTYDEVRQYVASETQGGNDVRQVKL